MPRQSRNKAIQIALCAAAIWGNLNDGCAADSSALQYGVVASAGIFDGMQSNSVLEASVVGASRATLSFCVQSPTNENSMYVVLAEYGQFFSNNSFRVTFNGKRERRICGFYGDARVYSAPNALDDGQIHHVALDIAPGHMMTLWLDGKSVDAVSVPSRGFSEGPLAIAQRVVKGSADDAWYYEKTLWSRFRGRISGVSLKSGAYGREAADRQLCEGNLTLPPNPYAMTPQWEKPKTTRRYLQGPFSERILTFWREGKIVFGEVEHRDDWSLAYTDLRSHAAWLVHGADDEPFDFRTAEMSLPEGGAPDHSQKWRTGELEVELAACAPFGRRSSAFARLTVRNKGASILRETFAFLLREGQESKLVFDAPDVYRIYNPTISDWADIPSDGWWRDGDVMWHDDRFASFSGSSFEWDGKKGAVRVAFDLKPGEIKTVEMELGKNERMGFGYADARKAMRNEWRQEMAKMRLPGGMTSQRRRIVRNLAVQMLQCLSMSTDGDFVLPRQGGLQRYVWPGDAECFLEGLDVIGYGEYVAKAIDFYYGQCQREGGEAGPFRNNWAGDTASVLKTFARHCCLTGDADCWRKWRMAAFKAFGWIESKRIEGAGLFPAMKATDHPAVLRAWGSTDMKGLEAYAALARAAAKFGDARAAEVSMAESSYRAAIGKVMNVWRAKALGKDEFEVPITAEGNDDMFLESFMFYLHPGIFVENGFLTADEMSRLRTWLIRRGYANVNGLYGSQLSRDPACRNHIWYTTWAELQWFRGWRSVGRNDLACLCRDACLKYALTDEFYVGERYHDANPWFYPWSPNASGSGRVILMLLDR